MASMTLTMGSIFSIWILKMTATATVHQWLVNATDGHTSEKPMDKRTCVRVRYAGQHHVDLPAYGELNGKYLLAVKGETKWPHSDPMALTDWFVGQVKSRGEQLRRIVRYLKAWADFKSNRGGKMPSGVILTVLAANHFRAVAIAACHAGANPPKPWGMR